MTRSSPSPISLDPLDFIGFAREKAAAAGAASAVARPPWSRVGSSK